MKKIVTTLMVALALAGCSSPLTSGGRTYEPYGLFNDEKKSEQVCYETNTSDVVFGVLLVETIIVPVTTFGFDFKEPKRMKDSNGNCN
jgi:uncharacterized protein YceK